MLLAFREYGINQHICIFLDQLHLLLSLDRVFGFLENRLYILRTLLPARSVLLLPKGHSVAHCATVHDAVVVVTAVVQASVA